MAFEIGKRFDVLLDGGYFSDLVFTGLPEFPRLGHEIYSREFDLVPGGAYNTAIAMHRLRLKVAWPCCFGSDPFSQFVRGSAVREGLDASFFEKSMQPSLRITVAFSFDHERAFLSYSDPVQPLPLLKLLKKLRPGWLCVTHWRLERITSSSSGPPANGTRAFLWIARPTGRAFPMHTSE
jgi:Sugar kinases, ribokinase family